MRELLVVVAGALALCVALTVCNTALAGNIPRLVGDPVLDPPTLHSLGAYWIVDGDQNHEARVEVEYRNAGAADWKKGYPFLRVEKETQQLPVPEGSSLFAGSVVLLEPDTVYELKLTLVQPDGMSIERILTARTIAEPVAPENAPTYHVVPGNGGGTGTKDDPYRGLDAAQENAKPGDLFLVHTGVYEGTFTIKTNGEPGKPIIWRGAGDGEAVIDAQGAEKERPERGINASNAKDVWFENLSVRNAKHAVVGNMATRLVIRHCHLYQTEYGISVNRDDGETVTGFFISDNVMEGPSTWPRTKGIENARGIQITGAGHVIRNNRIRGYADAIDTFQGPLCVSIDIHNNDISECTDDGIELDYSQRNTRAFDNRLTNIFQGISTQPVYGGPVYIFRNALYNVQAAAFKMHNDPSGVLVFHNTSVKDGMPLVLWTNSKVNNSVYRNNLFIGRGQANYAYETTAQMINCDFDFDGFGGGPWGNFLKWNGVRYPSVEAVRLRAPVYRHALSLDPTTVFATGLQAPDDVTKQYDTKVNDLRLREGTAAIDAGEFLPNFSDGFLGEAPDLGAFEFGSELPIYGPRPEK